MSSQASWQTGALSYGSAGGSEEFPDQQSVESLLRRLVQQVEDTERRYSDALNDLQGRLDQLALKTEAARASGASDDSATLDRLHDQVSGLARRFEREAVNSLDDFERLGRAVLGRLDRNASGLATGDQPAPFASPFAAEPLQFASSPFALPSPFAAVEPAMAATSPFPFAPNEPRSGFTPFLPLPDADRDLSKRLVEMAERLEHSVDEAMAPKALDDLTRRIEAMGRQISGALAALPKPVSLEPIERQIADIGHRFDRAESELAKIGAIETALHRLIERVDAQAGELGDIAAKAATEAARLVAGEAKLDAATAERLDAMHRDLKAMSERSSTAGDRLAVIVESVHDSLRQLVQQAERNAARATGLKPHAPFAEAAPAESHEPSENGPAGGSEQRDLARASRPDTPKPLGRTVEAGSPFGRAKRVSGDSPRDLDDDKSTDRDAPRSHRVLGKKPARTEAEMEEDLVAAARRAAQAASRRAAERPDAAMRKWTPPGARASSRLEASRVASPRVATGGAERARPEAPSRRSRPVLVISAAVLLILSAILLYSRLQTKPWPELLPPAAETSTPAPQAPTGSAPLPSEREQAPAAAEPERESPAPSPTPVAPDAASNATRDTASDAGADTNFTDIAKSSSWPATVVEEPAAEAPGLQQATQAKPAALQQVEEPQLPPGIVFTVEDPSRSF